MPQFMVLLYDSPALQERFAGLAPEELHAMIQRYGEWSERLAAEGKLLGGEKLRDGEGRVVRGAGPARTVVDGPFSETKELIGGFFLIEANGYEEAVELTADCPHLGHGGTVEIREVEPVPAP